MRGTRLIRGLSLLLLTAWSGLTTPVCGAATSENDEPDSRVDAVVLGVAPARATRITAHVAAIRRDIHSTLFGSDVLPPWTPPCMVHIHRDRASFARAVVGAPMTALGATSIEFAGSAIRLRRIDVMDSADGGIPGALDHELVHAVLADHFTEQPPPRWADEGLATLFDTPAKQQGHDADFRAAATRGQAWKLTDLMTLEIEPADTGRQRVFYGQSAALVRWMIAQAGGPTFLRFLHEEAVYGPGPALQKHYGIDSIADLEGAFLQKSAALK